MLLYQEEPFRHRVARGGGSMENSVAAEVRSKSKASGLRWLEVLHTFEMFEKRSITSSKSHCKAKAAGVSDLCAFARVESFSCFNA
ncbi:MAG: hypothetical protein K0Q83_637 [Deltaproteobacteria bacterium]|nr:hypothetical protein [Deltaproteobacteria bacterium]